MDKSKHVTTVQKYDDLQVHVRIVEADGLSFVDIRDYVPSAEQYGRGIMLPLGNGQETVAEIANALFKVVREP